MKRTTKKERKQNAICFYENFKKYSPNKVAVVVKRNPSTTNPYVRRTQFLTLPVCNGKSQYPNCEPVVIAESSTHGLEGCYMEFIEFVYGGRQDILYYEDRTRFFQWFYKTLGIKITYDDNFVIMFEKN